MDYVIEPSYTMKNNKMHRSYEDTITRAVKSSKVNTVNIEDMYTGVNLLINSNLKDPINTSGNATFTSKAGEDITTKLTCIDCWEFNKNRVEGMLDGDISITINNSGLTVSYNNNLTISGNAYAMCQKINNPNRYSGEYITISAEYSDTINPNMVLALIADGTVIASVNIKEAIGIVYCSALILEDYKELYVAITNKEGNVEATSATFSWIQAEVGKAPTMYKSKSREVEALLVDYACGNIGGSNSNADTVDGHHANDFVNSVSNYLTEDDTILNWAINPDGVYRKFIVNALGFPSDSPLKVEGFLELFEDSDKLRKIICFKPYNKFSAVTYSRAIFNSEWTTDWELGYLPSNGGLVSGGAIYNTLDEIGFAAYSGTQNGSYIEAYKNDYINRRSFFVGNKDAWPDISTALRFVDIENGEQIENYCVFHEGNKPTGTYIGTGEATERIIDTGGFGNALLVWANDTATLVTPGGPIGATGSTALVYSDSHFINGVLTISTSDNLLNGADITYSYQVL